MLFDYENSYNILSIGLNNLSISEWSLSEGKEVSKEWSCSLNSLGYCLKCEEFTIFDKNNGICECVNQEFLRNWRTIIRNQVGIGECWDNG